MTAILTIDGLDNQPLPDGQPGKRYGSTSGRKIINVQPARHDPAACVPAGPHVPIAVWRNAGSPRLIDLCRLARQQGQPFRYMPVGRSKYDLDTGLPLSSSRSEDRSMNNYDDMATLELPAIEGLEFISVDTAKELGLGIAGNLIGRFTIDLIKLHKLIPAIGGEEWYLKYLLRPGVKLLAGLGGGYALTQANPQMGYVATSTILGNIVYDDLLAPLALRKIPRIGAAFGAVEITERTLLGQLSVKEKELLQGLDGVTVEERNIAALEANVIEERQLGAVREEVILGNVNPNYRGKLATWMQ